jgi:hypothetical protein
MRIIRILMNVRPSIELGCRREARDGDNFQRDCLKEKETEYQTSTKKL